MLRLLADENFSGYVVRGLRLRRPDIDVVRVQDTPVYTMDDPSVLAWAADNNRIVLTHDRGMSFDAYARIAEQKCMPGLIIVSRRLSRRQVINDLLLMDELGEEDEWENCVVYLPL